MNKANIITYFFEHDGDMPNNRLPVVIYKNALEQVATKDFELLFCQHGWSNNWQDVILPTDHFHSNTHEVLGLKSGQARLMLGGKQGKLVTVETGDVIILPAGVGHYSVDNSMKYQFVGGYPNGADWNLKFGLIDEDRLSILAEIAAIPIPDKDPIFGISGPLLGFWS